MCVCVSTGAKAGGHSELAEEARSIRSSSSLPPWLWITAHCEAQHEQPSPRLALLWREQGLSGCLREGGGVGVLMLAGECGLRGGESILASMLLACHASSRCDMLPNL